MAPPKIIDIDDVILNAARKYPFMSDLKRVMDEDLLLTDINMKHLRVIHDAPMYKNQHQIGKGENHTLFSATFNNSTTNEQTYNFSTQRKTRSTCTLLCTRGFRFAAHMDIKMMPPNPVLQANGGFKSEMFLTKSDGQTFESELVWSVDSHVKVPPGNRTTAALVIKEDEYNGDFTVTSHFSGKIHITPRRKKDNTPLTTVTMKVEDVFTEEAGFVHEGEGNKRDVYCITQGSCKCRYGIKQRVKLTEKRSDQGDSDNEE